MTKTINAWTKLSLNKNILQAANTVIQNNINRKEKSLWTDNHPGDKISVYFASDEYAETNYVADQIEELKRENPSMSYDDFAIYTVQMLCLVWWKKH